MATRNLAFLVNFGGRTVLHVGDAADLPLQGLPAFHLPSMGVDVALIPYWQLLDEKAAGVIRREIRPKHVIAMHLVIRDSTTASVHELLQVFGGSDGVRHKILATSPEAILPQKPLDTWDF